MREYRLDELATGKWIRLPLEFLFPDGAPALGTEMEAAEGTLYCVSVDGDTITFDSVPPDDDA